MNKQGIYFLALLLWMSCSLSAQTLRAEYWLDADPGQGQAIAVSVDAGAASVEIPTAELSSGWHTAGIRVKQSKWSQTYTHRFFIATPTDLPDAVNGAEYWVDTDPGQGDATELPFTAGQTAFAVDVPTESLEPGFHVTGIRIRYGNTWSETYTHRFFIAPVIAATELNAAEYWVDTDPGQGNAKPLAVSASQTEFALDVQQIDTLAEGYHTLGVRIRYGELWSQTYTHRFLRTVKQTVVTKIEAIEAYWDDDVTQTTAIPFTQVGDSAVIDGYDFPTETLSYGIHYLYIHAKVNGVWSILNRYEICKNAIPAFTVLDEEALCVGDEVIIVDESSEVQPETTYAWDVDGDGKTDYTDKGDIMHTFTKAGRYTVTLTVQTGSGCETVYTHEVYVHTKSTPSVSLSRSKSSICAGDSVVFTATPTNGGEHPTYMWLRNGTEISGVTGNRLVLYDMTNKETVQVQLTADNPCVTTKTALSSVLTQTVYDLPVIVFNLADTYYTDDKAFSLTNMATPTGGTFYINDAEAKLFNPKANEQGEYVVRYVVKNSNGCQAEAEHTFTLTERGAATDIDNIPLDALHTDKPVKVLLGGILYILMPDGRMYNMQGKEVK